MKPKVSRRNEIIKIRAQLNKIENRKTIEKIKATKSSFISNINKTDKPLVGLIKGKREKTHTKT